MEPIIVLPAEKVKEMIDRYEKATQRLIDAERELAALKDDKYVTWEWVCEYFGISRSTAALMLAEEKAFVYGRQIKRFKKSVIIRFAEKNSIQVKEIQPLPHLKGRRSN
ncbi:hypothetical protein [Spirosoma sp. KNUC1025]|uniref:hypothetical protein n=1 Tax=Spirosoma sp. KNUC1025 TaxID=2894082 RepID=UPI003865D967|nr:hypothetical protein LN737_05105 [Spirosoma sp. KNUC1025]